MLQHLLLEQRVSADNASRQSLRREGSGSGKQKAREARERWPQRFQVYAGADPVFPEQAFDQLEEQVEELNPVGLKLYPNSYTADGVVGWHMDDPEIAFPLFQRALEPGLKAS
jgi:hypothetical protein